MQIRHLTTVLVVDNDAGVRGVIAYTLEQHGYPFFVAESGKQAVEVVEGHPEITMVLLDVNMPEMDGPETLKRIRQIKPFLQVAFITTTAHQYTREHLLSLGRTAVLEKPLGMLDLVRFLSWFTPTVRRRSS